MKSLSIGSPFLSYIQNQNRSQSSQVESMSTTTHLAMRVLNEFAPQISKDRLKLALESKVMVAIYHSVETLGGFLAKTTCLIRRGDKLFPSVIEYCWLEAYQLSMPEKLGMQLVKETSQVREYHVSTLPPTLRRVQNRKTEHLSGGLLVDQYPE